ncbi:AraC family transcriptional regulator [Halioxenophilus aromaticivorans]|uniref:AraC family transcriptional regulator n=1 Tax=Halioxenophilus aromaticivorans TaxID=1306992 RepID=A0AAV3TXM5_9ALTE
MTAANNFFSDLFLLAESKGIPRDVLLDRTGVPESALNAGDTRIPAEKLALIVESLWDHLQDEAMGIGQHPIPRGAFQMMGKLAIHEANLADALTLGVQLYGMVTKAYSAQLDIDGDLATLSFRLAPGHQDHKHLLAEIVLMSWHRFASWLIAESITLNHVLFDYSAPAHASEYAYLFPGKHRFNEAALGLVFHKNYLEHSVVRSPESLAAFVRRGPKEFFMQPETDFSLSQDVKRILQRRLQEGFPIIEDVAGHLNMTKRTLIRRLKMEGTSYQQLKDLVRRDKAVHLLAHKAVPVSEIAQKVGFSDPAVFARAFKTWTGVSPRCYRAERLDERAVKPAGD